MNKFKIERSEIDKHKDFLKSIVEEDLSDIDHVEVEEFKSIAVSTVHMNDNYKKKYEEKQRDKEEKLKKVATSVLLTDPPVIPVK